MMTITILSSGSSNDILSLFIVCVCAVGHMLSSSSMKSQTTHSGSHLLSSKVVSLSPEMVAMSSTLKCMCRSTNLSMLVSSEFCLTLRMSCMTLLLLLFTDMEWVTGPNGNEVDIGSAPHTKLFSITCRRT